MTEEQIEAVARAIYLSMYGDKGGRWECVEPRHQADVWGEYARAAIAAYEATLEFAGWDVWHPDHKLYDGFQRIELNDAEKQYGYKARRLYAIPGDQS